MSELKDRHNVKQQREQEVKARLSEKPKITTKNID